ncbi:hypothetical protein GOBAR_AA15259 [Gossypium barbadense]|uniref:Uncharacterized protein n=1 Tax=Gossypium barbadense TaxID=3634 RepID=A0A2P5XPX6_GOSBA|nr:hypothetical protein GOBAR_AA15259 [Gossypium barbadense]
MAIPVIWLSDKHQYRLSFQVPRLDYGMSYDFLENKSCNTRRLMKEFIKTRKENPNVILPEKHSIRCLRTLLPNLNRYFFGKPLLFQVQTKIQGGGGGLHGLPVIVVIDSGR